MLGSIFSKWFLGTLKTKNKEYRVKAVQKGNKYVKNRLTPIYMATLFPGLVQALQQNVPLTTIYMTTLFPGLVQTLQ